MVVYKETLAFAKIDPNDPPTWTGTWRDPSFSPPADGGRPENTLTGTLFMVNGPGTDNPGSLSIKVPAADGKMRFWRNIPTIANQAAGQTFTLPAGTLGYEWDSDLDNGARPAGLFDLSTAAYALTTDLLLDQGATYGAGNATHHMTMYRAPSGALVFGAGSVQWAWGLDNNHDNSFGFPTPAPSSEMQQAMVNLFADMGIQPATLQSGLTLATKSTDTTPPTSTITFPTAGSTVTLGNPVTITGTAADSGGGVVGGVEVSVDGGTTWHLAPGRESWSYIWTPGQVGPATLKSRAVDDSGNLETPSAGNSVTVASRNSGETLFTVQTPVLVNVSDGPGVNYELGTAFSSGAPGYVTAVRFWKASNETGTHTGHLWTAGGQSLGSVTFTNESASGWQQENLSTPVLITANTPYVVSVNTGNTFYVATVGGLTSQVVNQDLSSVVGNNGLLIGTPGQFPTTGSSNHANYFRDIIFAPTILSASGQITPAATATGTTLTLSGTSNAVTSADSSGNYSFPGLTNGSYTVTPSLANFMFTPASRSFNVNGSAVTGLNFTVAPATYSISGNISPAASAAGATVTLSGAASATVSVNATGGYAFSGLSNGSYTVTPNKEGALFSPANQPVTVSAANVTGVNFTDVQTFTISGAISPAANGSGATVTLSGAASGVVTADTFGNYAFTGLSNGSYTVTPTRVGYTLSPSSQTVTVSGTDVFNVNFAALANSGEETLFTSQMPALPNQSDGPGLNYELGTVFTSGKPGYVTALRFWKASSELGTHTGNLWTAAGVLLASVTFTNETASGWQRQNLATPFQIAANTQYVVSVNTTNAFYAATAGGLTSQVVNQDLSSVVGNNGVLDTTPGHFPSASFGNANYFRDIVFVPQNYALASVSVNSLVATGGALVTGTVTLNLPAPQGGAVVTLLGNNNSVGLVGASVTVPAGAMSANFNVQTLSVVNPAALTITGTYNGSQSTTMAVIPAGATAASVLAPNLTPTPPVDNQGAVPLELGVRFNSDIGGYVLGVQFYKGPQNLGTHVGNLWTKSGQLLATATFTGETASGWQQVIFSTPVLIAAHTDYIASYHSSTGDYSADWPYFNAGTPADNAPLHFLGDTPSTPNGVFATGVTSTFPNTSSNGTNFWVDVLFDLPSTSLTVPSQFLPDGYQGGFYFQTVVATGGTQPYRFSLASGNLPPGLTLSSNGIIDGTPLSAGTYNFTVRATDSSSPVVQTATQPLGLTIAPPGGCPCTIWSGSTPIHTTSGGTTPIELGMRFQADMDGVITAIQFYKGTADTGSTHKVSLWTSDGQLLSSATSTVETGPGNWQVVNLPSAVHISAHAPYIASYHSSGDYANDPLWFATGPSDAVPLHAPADMTGAPNGVFSTSGTPNWFPNNTSLANNYWIDITYNPDLVAGPSITSVTINPSSAKGSTTGTVTISGPAPLDGAIVNLLSSYSPLVTVPATATIPQGATSTTFPITMVPVPTPVAVTITAFGNGIQTGNMTVLPPSLTGVSLNPTAVIGGTSSTGTVTLDSPASVLGVAVTLSSNNTTAATVPASVNVASGSTTATFTVTTNAVSSTTPVIISAAADVTQTATLTINPSGPGPVTIPLLLILATSGTSSGTAPATGIPLSTDNISATTPASSPSSGGSNQSTGSTVPATPLVAVTPSNTLDLGLSRTTVTAGGKSEGTVTLSSPAPAGGALVTLSSDNTAAATVPASVTVEEGATTAKFTVNTGAVTAPGLANISATYGDNTQKVALTVMPSTKRP
jgi:hypothetical protein